MRQYVELSTADVEGRRKWVFPSPPRGKWTNRRRLLAYLLISFFLLAPWIRLRSKPLVFVDIFNARIDFFGASYFINEAPVFLASVFFLFSAIFLFTALFGRVFCGWICPHTVFMEFVYRPIERVLEGYGAAQKLWKKRALSSRLPVLTTKLLIFFSIAFILSNSFLAYFLGADRLMVLIKEGPFEHWKLFLSVLICAGVFTFHFTWFREQLCLFVCPYGRLQSILLDKNSLIVAYDKVRGEPRGKVGSTTGDCVDCKACVRVCPTGIDIRDGLQLECVQCTACIDACDDIMTKVKRPLGLIRYQSENEVERRPKKILRPRVLAYAALVLISFSLLLISTGTRSSFSAVINRESGREVFLVDSEGWVTNAVRMHLGNRLDVFNEIVIEALDPSTLQIVLPGRDKIRLAPQSKDTLHMLLKLPQEEFQAGNGLRDIKLKVSDHLGNEKMMKLRLLGPAGGQ